MNGRTEIVNISAAKIESKVRSKGDLYDLFKDHCKKLSHEFRLVLSSRLSLLPNQIPQRDLDRRQISKWKFSQIQVLKVEDVLTFNVPKYDELALGLIYGKVLNKFPEMEDYFPHYDDEYLPPRDFFWGIFSTLHGEFVKKMIKKAQERGVCNMETQADEMIRIRDDMLDQLETIAFESSKNFNDRKKEWKSNTSSQDEGSAGF